MSERDVDANIKDGFFCRAISLLLSIDGGVLGKGGMLTAFQWLIHCLVIRLARLVVAEDLTIPPRRARGRRGALGVDPIRAKC